VSLAGETKTSETDPAADLLHWRYRDGKAPDGPWNEVLATILGHRSVRAFLPTALPEGTLERLVAAAQSASTSSNLQTWSVIAVEDQARKDRLAELGARQKHIAECPLYLVWCVDHSRLHLAAQERQMVLTGLNFLEPYIVGVVDASLAAQNAAVALESLGLGFVYIGGMRNHPEQVAATLGLPPHVMALFGMCVGYPDPEKPADIKPRLPMGAGRCCTVSNIQPQRTRRPLRIMMRASSSFSASKACIKPHGRSSSPTGLRKAALNGRDRIREALNTLGFPIR
jgi:nitroreductase